jgi:hypothetical protein
VLPRQRGLASGTVRAADAKLAAGSRQDGPGAPVLRWDLGVGAGGRTGVPEGERLVDQLRGVRWMGGGRYDATPVFAERDWQSP